MSAYLKMLSNYSRVTYLLIIRAKVFSLYYLGHTMLNDKKKNRFKIHEFYVIKCDLAT